MADGVMKRMSFIFKSKANKALDKYEDPRETLDYSYQKQLELLQKVRRGVADVATSRKRVELQMKQLQQQSEKLEGQARKALELGREDLAREALTRRGTIQEQITGLDTQYQSLQTQEENLVRQSQQLQSKVDAFRTQKETIKATYTAAEASARIGEAFTGISEEMSDVGLAMQRAQDKTAQLQARAAAVDELMASGALDDPTNSLGTDDLSRQLAALSSGPGVDDQLAKMKLELAGGSTKALEPGAAGMATPGEVQDADVLKDGDSQ